MSCQVKIYDYSTNSEITTQNLNNALDNLYNASKTFRAMIDYIEGSTHVYQGKQRNVTVAIIVSDSVVEGDTVTLNKAGWQAKYPGVGWPGDSDDGWVIEISPGDIDGENYSDGIPSYREGLESLIAHEITHIVEHLVGYKGLITANGDDDDDIVKVADQIMNEAKHWPKELREQYTNFPIEGDGQTPHIYNKSTPADVIPCEPKREKDIPTAEDMRDLLATATSRGSPLVLDLDDSGTIDLVSLANSEIFWDIDQDGFAEASGWVTSDDGLLALDINENGVIDDNGELFGTVDTDGFTILAQYDSNDDSIIDAEDAIWDSLLVWRDDNQNGRSEEAELYSLQDFDIVSFDLNAAESSSTNEGHEITHTSVFTVDDGINPPDARIIHDVWFEHDNVYTKYNEQYPLDLKALALGLESRGYGNIPDLLIAASIDNDMGDTDSLLYLLSEFATLGLEDIFAENTDALTAVADIMYRWAGVEEADVDGRGPNIDGRRLEFLEAFGGQPFLQGGHNPNPGSEAGFDLNRAFEIGLNRTFANLVVQSAGEALFDGDFQYQLATDSFSGIDGLNLGTLGELETIATGLSNTSERTIFWQNVVRVIEFTVGVDALDGGDVTALEDAIFDSDNSLDLYDDILGAIEGNSTLYGNGDNDEIAGDSLANTINGGAGSDRLEGRTNDDTLNGDEGSDYLLGEGGNDTFVYNSGDGFDVVREEQTGSGHNADTILFGAGIDLADLTFTRGGQFDLIIGIDNGIHVGEIVIENQFNVITHPLAPRCGTVRRHSSSMSGYCGGALPILLTILG